MKPYFGPGGNSDCFKLAGYKSTVDAPGFVSRMGLDAYEYEAGNGLSASPETLKKIGEQAALYDVKLTYHAPYFISLSGVVEETRLKSISYIKQSIESARLLGAKTIVVHCGSAAKISRDEAMRLSADTLIRTLNSVETYGIKIGIETMGKINQLGTLNEVLELCRIDSSIVPVVDFGHLYARSCGTYLLCRDDFKRVFDTIAIRAGDDIARNLHCHFSKIEWTGSGEKRHLTFASDEYGPQFEPLIDVIVEEKLYPTIICESAGTQALDALQLKEYYNKTVKEK